MADYTLAELQQFSAGYPQKFGTKFMDAKIPTFKEGLELLVQYPDAVMIMDIKEENLGSKIAQVLSEVIASHANFSVYDRIVASCWTETQVQDISQYLNITVKQKLGSAPAEKDITSHYFSDLLEQGVHALSLSYGSLTEKFVQAAHLRMMVVVSWTVDMQKDVDLVLDLDVDGIITNFPKKVKQWISDRQRECANEADGSNGDDDDDDDHFDTKDVVLLSLGLSIGGFLLGCLSVGGFLIWKKKSAEYTQLWEISHEGHIIMSTPTCSAFYLIFFYLAEIQNSNNRFFYKILSSTTTTSTHLPFSTAMMLWITQFV